MRKVGSVVGGGDGGGSGGSKVGEFRRVGSVAVVGGGYGASAISVIGAAGKGAEIRGKGNRSVRCAEGLSAGVYELDGDSRLGHPVGYDAGCVRGEGGLGGVGGEREVLQIYTVATGLHDKIVIRTSSAGVQFVAATVERVGNDGKRPCIGEIARRGACGLNHQPLLVLVPKVVGPGYGRSGSVEYQAEGCAGFDRERPVLHIYPVILRSATRHTHRIVEQPPLQLCRGAVGCISLHGLNGGLLRKSRREPCEDH